MWVGMRQRRGRNTRGSSNLTQTNLRPNPCACCKNKGHWEHQCPELSGKVQETFVATLDDNESWAPADLTLADSLVKIQLGNDKEVEFLKDTGATFSVLN